MEGGGGKEDDDVKEKAGPQRIGEPMGSVGPRAGD